MKWTRVLLGVLGSLALAACAQDRLPTAPQGWEFVPGHGSSAVISPNSYMEAVGCVPNTGPRDSTTIVFKLIGGGAARFDCPGGWTDSVRAGIHAYRDAVFAATGAMTSGGGGDDGYVFVHIFYQCEQVNHYQYAPAMGEYVWIYTNLENCEVTEVWVEGAYSGGGPMGSWGPGGTAPPQDSTSYQDMEDDIGIPDLGVTIQDVDPLIDCKHVKCPKVSVLLNSPAVEQAIQSLMNMSHADSLEHGAWLYMNSDGTVRVGPFITGTMDELPSMDKDHVPPTAIGSLHVHAWDDFGPSNPDFNLAVLGHAYVVVGAPHYLWVVSESGGWFKQARAGNN